MNKKIIALILSISMTMGALSGCSAIKANLELANNGKDDAKANETEKMEVIPYYSVTNAYVNHEKNFCYELDVRIPIIEYSNEESDALIDPINKEIYSTIMSLVAKSVENAYDTYETYLESAKTNFIADREKKLEALKIKYKSIMGPDEVKALANLMQEKVEIVASDSEVEAFATSQDIIGEGPHNKRIIMPDAALSSSITQTTIAIEGRPGRKKNDAIMPPEGTKSNIEKTQNKVETTKESNITEKTNITKETNENKKQTLDKSIVPSERKFPPIGKGPKKASLSQLKNMDIFRRPPKSTESEIVEFVDITVENFYKELARIAHTRIPSKRELTWQFIPTYICYDFDVKCLDDEYLSLLINISEERVNTKVRRLYYNIDLKNKKLVTLKDLKGDDYTGDENAFFINNNHEPIVLLDKYAITE